MIRVPPSVFRLACIVALFPPLQWSLAAGQSPRAIAEADILSLQGELASPGTSAVAVRIAMKNGEGSGIARVDGDPATIGFLKGYSGRHAMIVNRNPARNGRIRVAMQDRWAVIEMDIHSGGRGIPRKGEFTINLEPGDGRLFRIEQSKKPD